MQGGSFDFEVRFQLDAQMVGRYKVLTAVRGGVLALDLRPLEFSEIEPDPKIDLQYDHDLSQSQKRSSKVSVKTAEAGFERSDSQDAHTSSWRVHVGGTPQQPTWIFDSPTDLASLRGKVDSLRIRFCPDISTHCRLRYRFLLTSGDLAFDIQPRDSLSPIRSFFVGLAAHRLRQEIAGRIRRIAGETVSVGKWQCLRKKQ